MENIFRFRTKISGIFYLGNVSVPVLESLA